MIAGRWSVALVTVRDAGLLLSGEDSRRALTGQKLHGAHSAAARGAGPALYRVSGARAGAAAAFGCARDRPPVQRGRAGAPGDWCPRPWLPLGGSSPGYGCVSLRKWWHSGCRQSDINGGGGEQVSDLRGSEWGGSAKIDRECEKLWV